MASPEVKEKLASIGGDLTVNSPDEFATFIRNEKDKWSKVIKTANIKAD